MRCEFRLHGLGLGEGLCGIAGSALAVQRAAEIGQGLEPALPGLVLVRDASSRLRHLARYGLGFAPVPERSQQIDKVLRGDTEVVPVPGLVLPLAAHPPRPQRLVESAERHETEGDLGDQPGAVGLAQIPGHGRSYPALGEEAQQCRKVRGDGAELEQAVGLVAALDAVPIDFAQRLRILPRPTPMPDRPVERLQPLQCLRLRLPGLCPEPVEQDSMGRAPGRGRLLLQCAAEVLAHQRVGVDVWSRHPAGI